MKKNKRPANRPLKYGEETIVIQTRIPKSKKQLFKSRIAAILKKWEVKKK